MKKDIYLVRTIPTEEVLQINPSFYEDFKAGSLIRYKKELEGNSLSIKIMHDLVSKEMGGFSKPIKKENQFSYDVLNICHMKIDRMGLVESMAILDNCISDVLFNFRVRKLNQKADDTVNYDKIDHDLDNALKGPLPVAFQESREIVKNFRNLRHQFAHFPIGLFCFAVKDKKFELFLDKLEGIKIVKSSMANINKVKNKIKRAEEGAVINYVIVSDAFNKKFEEESVRFFSMLLEISFPTETKKVFNF